MLKKTIVVSLVAATLLFTGCGEDTDEANQYDAEYQIDKKNYSAALALLNDGCAGYGEVECNMLKGSAYMGMAGYDFISIGKDLVTIDGNDADYPTDDDKTRALNEVVFDTLFDDNMKTGIEYYKMAFTGDKNATHCNGLDYNDLLPIEKDICLAINPILLQEIVGDEDTKTEATVDLETVLEFKDVMEAAIPGLTTSDMVQIISGGTSELGEKDLNDNNQTDELDVTNCVVSAINSSDTIAVSCSDFNITDESNVTIDGNDYTRVILSITGIVDGNSTTNQFYRLIQTGDINTTITTTENNVTVDGNVTNCNYYTDLSTCYPEPKKSEDGNVSTFSDTVVDILNNDTLLSSMAVLSDEGDATQTEEEKIDDFKEDICDGDSGTSTTCDTVDGELVITQDAILDYMSETK